MKPPVDIKRKIYSRLKDYLSRDRTGIRRALLNLFIKIKTWTIPEIFDALKEHFSITYHSLASMVGIIASRLGILHVRRTPDGTNAVYELKEQYVDVVTRLISN